MGDDEQDARQDWLADVCTFALTEIKDDVTVSVGNDNARTVSQGDAAVTISRDDFVAGVAGRAAAGTLEDDAAALLGLGY